MKSRYVCLAGIVLFLVMPVWIFGQETRVPLRNQRESVVEIYENISQMSRGNAIPYYHSLALAMREDLWTLQLEYSLTQFTDFNDEQRSVLYEAIGLLSSGFIGRTGLAADQNPDDGISLSRLENRATLVLSKEVVRKIFVNLGGLSPKQTSTSTLREKKLDRGRVVVPNVGSMPACACASSDNWCDLITNPNPHCNSEKPCIPYEGCGWWWSSWCDGMCTP